MAKKKVAAQSCCDDKMCGMACCPCRLDIKKLKPLVRNPKFICKTCGRVAADKKYLCDPVSLG
jgi:transposase-like protein